MEILDISVLFSGLAILVFSLSLIIFVWTNLRSSRLFSFTLILVSVWTFLIGLFLSSSDYVFAHFLLKICFSIGIVIAHCFFLYFSTIQSDFKIEARHILWLMVTLAFSVYVLATDGIISEIKHIMVWSGPTWGWSYGSYYLIYYVIFLYFILYGIFSIHDLYIKANDPILRKNYQFLFVAYVVGIVPPVVSYILLPLVGIYHLNIFGPISGLMWVPIMAYSIIKYNQMNVRVIATQALAIAMTAIFFINIWSQDFMNASGRVATFSAFLLSAIFLFLSIRHENRTAEALADVNRSLEHRVLEQTELVREALQLEKRARIDLEKLIDSKDKFVAITHHNLRTPINRILWSVEDINKANNSHIDKDQFQRNLNSIYLSAKKLIGNLDDFMTTTTNAMMNHSSSILNYSKIKLPEIMSEILSDLKMQTDSKSIAVDIQDYTNGISISGDKVQLHESFFVFLDNAVKYNHDGGSICIRLESAVSRDNYSEILINIESTGIGIDKTELTKLGTSNYYRGDDAKSANPQGMGIGLYLARSIIMAHKGAFSITSEGKGRGANIRISLPTNQ